MLRKSVGRRQARGAPARRARAGFAFEAAEPRLLFSTIQVTTLADSVNAGDGVTSLREALTQAAASPGPDTLNLTALNGDIVLDSALGSLIVDSDVTINGPAAAGVAVTVRRDTSSAATFRIFRVDAGRTATLSRLTISGGVADADGGGGILNRGDLTLADCIVRDNTAPDSFDGRGGGIANDPAGKLTVLRTTVLNNTAGGATTATVTFGRGGGIYSLGALTLTMSDVRGNKASGGFSDGGGVAAEAGSLSVADTTFTSNTAAGAGNGAAFGGGLYAGIGFTLTGGTFSGNAANAYLAQGAGAFFDADGANVAGANGQVTGTTFTAGSLTGFGGGGGGLFNAGPLTLTSVTVSNNNGNAFGGGIANDATGTLTLAQSRVSGNTLFGTGGGVANYGDLTIVDSTISANTANTGLATAPGGGVWNNKTLTVLQSTFQSNSGDQGGGIDNTAQGTARLYNATFSGNLAGLGAFTRGTAGSGGGVASAGLLTVVNCTFSGNRAAADGTGGAVYRSAGTATLHNTLAAGNFHGAGASAVSDDVAGSVDPASSHNLIGNGDRVQGILSGQNGNAMGTAGGLIDPKIGLLANNGGPTQTFALLTGSPAINLGDNARAVDASGAALATDQRGTGFPRIFDTTVDIGAYELQVNSPLPRPHDVTATPDSVSGSVFVGWANQPEPDFAYFNIYRSASSGGPYLPLANHLAASEYVDAAVSPGTTYYYVVTAVDTAGTESPQSLESFWKGGLQLIVSTAVDENDNNFAPGDLSLREAVRLAATQGDPGQTITFAPGLANVPIQLSDALGTMNLSRGVQVQGLGGGQTVLNTSGKFRVFQVDAGQTAAVSGLTIAGPDPTSPVSGTGGGITNNGTLTLTDVTIRGFNTQGTVAGGGGAAIQNTGTLTMTGGTLDRNRAPQNGGAVYSTGSVASLTFNGVTISNGGGASGGVFYVNAGTLTLTGCTVQGTTGGGNSSGTGGGAIYAVSATVRATNTLFAANTSTASTSGFSGGGAIFASGGTLTLAGCTFSGNSASLASGGALYLQGSVMLTASSCTFDNNSALTGGAVYDSSSLAARLVNSTLSANTARTGGGVYLSGAELRMTNCTLSGNAATIDGGAVYVSNSNTFTPVVFANVTITDNRADSDGNATGAAGGVYRAQGGPDLENAIVAGNVRGASSGTSTPDDLFGSFVGRSNVVGVGDGSSGLTNGSLGNQVGTAAAPIDPKLGPLAANGGPTLTHALLAGSPAADAGDNTRIAADVADLDGDGNTTEAVPFDQRGTGFARVSGAKADAGAVETQVIPPAVSSVAINDGSAQRSKVTSITVTFDRAVVLGSGAFTLVGRNGAGTGTTAGWGNPSGDGRTWVLSFGGSPVVGGSLADGVYDLTVVASQVHAGTAAGPALAANMTAAFHRLYSDADGDGDSDNFDLFQLRGTYLKPSTDPAYKWYFDYDAGGAVDNLDVFQVRSRRSIVFQGY